MAPAQSGASPDFKTGVTAVLVEKTAGRPAWSPATLGEVEDKVIEDNFFERFDASKGTAPQLVESTPFARDHGFMEFSLPTEDEIRKMVNGEHPSSGTTVITRDELVKAFIFEYGGKLGVKEKVLEVAARCCVEEPDKETNNKWLRWKGPLA